MRIQLLSMQDGPLIDTNGVSLYFGYFFFALFGVAGGAHGRFFARNDLKNQGVGIGFFDQTQHPAALHYKPGQQFGAVLVTFQHNRVLFVVAPQPARRVHRHQFVRPPILFFGTIHQSKSVTPLGGRVQFMDFNLHGDALDQAFSIEDFELTDPVAGPGGGERKRVRGLGAEASGEETAAENQEETHEQCFLMGKSRQESLTFRRHFTDYTP